MENAASHQNRFHGQRQTLIDVLAEKAPDEVPGPPAAPKKALPPIEDQLQTDHVGMAKALGG